MGLEAFIVNILKIVFLVIAGHLTLTKIIPLLDDILNNVIKDNKVADKFTSLLGILVIVLVASKIISLALLTENKVISYLSVVQPGLDLLLNLVPYFGYTFAGLVLIIALRNFKK